MDRHVGKTVRMVGDFVTYKPVRTKKGEMMIFGTFLDDQGNFFNTVHFPNSLKGSRAWELSGRRHYYNGIWILQHHCKQVCKDSTYTKSLGARNRE